MKSKLHIHELRDLKRELQEKVLGEVCFGDDYRALYATDASNYRQLPVGVVFPKTQDDIEATVGLCRKYDLDVLTRGGGTSLAGQCCNSGLVMDFSRHFNSVLDFDAESKHIRVQTGIVLGDLNRAVKDSGLIFGPDPATHNHCTIGGMVGNNSCGVHSLMAQFQDGGIKTGDFIEHMKILTYDGEVFEVGATSEDELNSIIKQKGRRGEIYSGLKAIRDEYAKDIKEGIPQIARRVSGYTLDELLDDHGFHVARVLAGSECTCVIVLEVTLRLIKNPKARSLLLMGYDTMFDAADAVPEILKSKPIALEGMDKKLITFMHRRGLDEETLKILPDGGGWLLVEFGGDTKKESDDLATGLCEKVGRNGDDKAPRVKLFDDPKEEHAVWKVREAGLGATAFVKGLPDMWSGWEDSSVPVEKVGDYLRDLRDLFDKFDYHPSLYGHFGQACIHCRIGFDLQSRKGIDHYMRFTEEAADLVVSYGGSLSGEHGDGQSRGPLLTRMYGPRLMEAFHKFKALWDPGWKMNPGKVIDPMAQDENLRLGTDFHPPELETHFAFPEDNGSFHRAAMRCVGVGECRKTDSGTMCPSYMVTRDEKHATRGRAHLLFEMMRGSEIKGGWKNKEVKESLDLCLACKGCLGECPVHVDMATYKAEFFSHYYDSRIRPRSAYAFGYVNKWASLASPISGLANAITHSKITGPIFKAIGGIAPQREVPRFAKHSFRHEHRKDPEIKNLDNAVLLWPDTFNNYFFPEVLEAGLKVLLSAGFDVIIPKRKFCCGRPLYDFGMLDSAKKYLKDILTGLQEYIQAGVPFVGFEASCIAVFRNELGNLFPMDTDARRLKESFKTLPEFILEHEDKFHFRNLDTTALMHRHCHHNAVMGYEADEKVLKKIGLELNVPDSGCCGLAGSYGFEKGVKYDISMKAGERKILPAVREMKEELLMTDGFSCREQIKHGTGRMPQHIAEVLATAVADKH